MLDTTASPRGGSPRGGSPQGGSPSQDIAVSRGGSPRQDSKASRGPSPLPHGPSSPILAAASHSAARRHTISVRLSHRGSGDPWPGALAATTERRPQRDASKQAGGGGSAGSNATAEPAPAALAPEPRLPAILTEGAPLVAQPHADGMASGWGSAEAILKEVETEDLKARGACTEVVPSADEIDGQFDALLSDLSRKAMQRGQAVLHEAIRTSLADQEPSQDKGKDSQRDAGADSAAPLGIRGACNASRLEDCRRELKGVRVQVQELRRSRTFGAMPPRPWQDVLLSSGVSGGCEAGEPPHTQSGAATPSDDLSDCGWPAGDRDDLSSGRSSRESSRDLTGSARRWRD